MSWLFPSGGQSIRASASASVLPMNICIWLPVGLTGLISVESKSLLQHHNSKASAPHCSAFFRASLIAQLVKNPPAMQETPQFESWVGKIPWRRERLPTPVFWPGEYHGLHSPWGCKESDTIEQLSLFSLLHGSALTYVHDY